MAELLIRAVDKINPIDPYKDAQLTKEFDVICVCANNWPWSHEERNNPQWRILALPNISIQEAELFIRAEHGDEKVNRVLQRRSHHINLMHPSLGLRDWWRDASRAEPIKTLDLTILELQDFIKQKPPRQDPAIIGP